MVHLTQFQMEWDLASNLHVCLRPTAWGVLSPFLNRNQMEQNKNASNKRNEVALSTTN